VSTRGSSARLQLQRNYYNCNISALNFGAISDPLVSPAIFPLTHRSPTAHPYLVPGLVPCLAPLLGGQRHPLSLSRLAVSQGGVFGLLNQSDSTAHLVFASREPAEPWERQSCG